MGKHRKLKIGDKVEYLEIIEDLGLRKYCGYNTTYFRCRCLKCGNIRDVPLKNLGTAQKDCGCWRKARKQGIEIGDCFGRLKVIGFGELVPGRGYKIVCQCSCPKNKIIEVRRDLLKNGEVQSCGCIHDELLRKNVKKYYECNFVGNTSATKILCDNPDKNNTSGIRGVSWHKRMQKWQARITYKKRTYHLGYFNNLGDAEAVIKVARQYRIDDFEDWYSKSYPKEWEKLKQSQLNRKTAIN